MNRRNFIKTAAAAAASTLAFPYILPSGRLFAQTNNVIADHVVLVLFAGGIRQQETIGRGYLAQSQNENIEGNILYNILEGAAPDRKIVYGTNGDLQGEIPIPKVLNQTLQSQGTLFAEMRSSSPGHYGGLNVCLQGNTVVSQGLRQKPVNPTIFEYLRRHAGLPATKVWFVGDGISNSIPLLNHSSHPDYGAQYAANFIAPTVTFSDIGFKHFANAKSYHPDIELDPIYKMKLFLDNSFGKAADTIGGIGNTDEEKYQIKQFLKKMYQATQSGIVSMPNVSDNADLTITGYAAEVIKEFEPNLTVLNYNNSDACHSNFTSYLSNLHRADHAVGFLWNYIQNEVPNMAGNTIILALPECGRNLEANPIRDENDWFGYDHSDANTSRIFSIMAGKGVPQNLVVGNQGNPVGYSADIAATIAHILGIKDTVLNSGLLAGNAMSLFDRI